MVYAVGPFRSQTCRYRLTIPAVSTSQNWKRVCVFLCHKTVIESYDRSRPYPFFFIQQFNSMLSTRFLFLSVCWILWTLSDFGNFCFQGFLIFFVSHFDICTRFPNWFDTITNWCCISIQSFRWTYERTALPYPFPDC